MELNIINDFLVEHVNHNIKWKELLVQFINYIDEFYKYNVNQLITHKINKLLTKIKSFGWIDKDIDNNENLSLTQTIIQTIINELSKIEDKNKKIGILFKHIDSNYMYVQENNKQNDKYSAHITRVEQLYKYGDYIPYYIYYDISIKCKLLKQILTILNYSFIVSDSIDEINQCDIIIPLSTYYYSQEEMNTINITKIIPSFQLNVGVIYIDYNTPNKEKYLDKKKYVYDFINLINNFVNHDDNNVYKYSYIVMELQ